MDWRVSWGIHCMLGMGKCFSSGEKAWWKRASYRAGGSGSINDPGRSALAQVKALQLPVFSGGCEKAMCWADGASIDGRRLTCQWR